LRAAVLVVECRSPSAVSGTTVNAAGHSAPRCARMANPEPATAAMHTHTLTCCSQRAMNMVRSNVRSLERRECATSRMSSPMQPQSDRPLRCGSNPVASVPDLCSWRLRIQSERSTLRRNAMVQQLRRACSSCGPAPLRVDGVSHSDSTADSRDDRNAWQSG